MWLSQLAVDRDNAPEKAGNDHGHAAGRSHGPRRWHRDHGTCQPVLWGDHVLKDVEPDDPAGRVLRLPRALGVRQNHSAAADRGLSGADRQGAASAARMWRPAAVEARRRHGVPVLCAVAAYDGGQECRLRPGGAPPAARRDRPPRRCRRSIWSAEAPRRAPMPPSYRAASSSASPGAHHRHRTQGAAAGRAAVEPRRQDAGQRAPRAALACSSDSASRRSS
jgi:hypothetical protein